MDEDSVVFRRIADDCRRLTIAEDSRKNPKMFRTYIIYFSESRVQSPESSPVQSPVQVLDYASDAMGLQVSRHRI